MNAQATKRWLVDNGGMLYVVDAADEHEAAEQGAKKAGLLAGTIVLKVYAIPNEPTATLQVELTTGAKVTPV